MLISVLMTCHNRRALTLASIKAIRQGTAKPETVQIFLVDDGSTDGTAQAVKDAYPEVVLIQGDGNLYWNRGMRLAWVHAIKKRTDFFLWLNDDLVIFPGSLDWLIETYEKSSSEDGRLIVVGKVISLNGETSYGGLVRASALSRLRFRSLHDGERCCDTMNGNCVLIPERAVSDIGINSNRFTHAFGDIDYGLRARRCDYRILEHSDAVGVQERGVAYSKPSSMSAGGIWKFLTSPKGMPMNEWYYFCRQYGGWLWPVNFISMYIKPFFSSIQRPGSNP